MPPKLLAEYRRVAAVRPGLFPTAFPPAAEAWYTYGGCFALAVAIHNRTHLPIEVYYFGGRPKHAYVVDGDAALDVRGRNPVRLVRLGAERLEQVDLVDALRALLGEQAPETLEILDYPEVLEAADRAAAIIAEDAAQE